MRIRRYKLIIFKREARTGRRVVGKIKRGPLDLMIQHLAEVFPCQEMIRVRVFPGLRFVFGHDQAELTVVKK